MLKIFKELRNETKRIVILPIIVGEMVGSWIIEASFEDTHVGREDDRSCSRRD